MFIPLENPFQEPALALLMLPFRSVNAGDFHIYPERSAAVSCQAHIKIVDSSTF